MSAYILRRVLQLVPVLLFTSAAVFFVFRVAPGDPAAIALGGYTDEATVDKMRKELGLDQPLVLQYFNWLGHTLRGDLGTSVTNHDPVLNLVASKLPVSLELSVLSILLALSLSLPIGILSAVLRGTPFDHLVRVFGMAGYCLPRYWLAVLLILFFAVEIRWFPVAGYVAFDEDPIQNLQHVALPVISVGLSLAAVQMRFLRSGMLEVLGQDYVRTACSKGLAPSAVLVGHALKNTLIPFVTVVGLDFGALLGGQVVTEQIFSWPGVGWLMIQAIAQRDYAVVQGAVLLIATGFVLINLLVDVSYAYLDPRIRYG